MNWGFIGVALAVGGNPIMRKSALALVATSALLVGLPAAKANFISIGASLDGGGITTLASGGGQPASLALPSDRFRSAHRGPGTRR